MPKRLSPRSSKPPAPGKGRKTDGTGHARRARLAFETEIHALQAAADRLDRTFVRSVDLLLGVSGKVVVTGIGKSGHIARKIASTFSSTGTPAFFMHPAEAVHGDLGMLSEQDAVLAVSQSGEGEELRAVLLAAKRLGIPMIAMTGNLLSQLAEEADEAISTHVEEEACPLNLAPTSSATVALVTGDALAVALLEAKGFGSDDFARRHPGGTLGRRLLTRVRDIMRTGNALPLISPEANVVDAIVEVSTKGMGMAIVVDGKGACKGIFTDGDLRRALEMEEDPREKSIGSVMTRSPVTIEASALAVDAVKLMESERISQLPVLHKGKVAGALNMHDLLKNKVV